MIFLGVETKSENPIEKSSTPTSTTKCVSNYECNNGNNGTCCADVCCFAKHCCSGYLCADEC